MYYCEKKLKNLDITKKIVKVNKIGICQNLMLEITCCQVSTNKIGITKYYIRKIFKSIYKIVFQLNIYLKKWCVICYNYDYNIWMLKTWKWRKDNLGN